MSIMILESHRKIQPNIVGVKMITGKNEPGISNTNFSMHRVIVYAFLVLAYLFSVLSNLHRY